MSMMILNREIFSVSIIMNTIWMYNDRTSIYTETISLDKGLKRIGRVVFSK